MEVITQVIIELRVVQFWCEITLLFSNGTHAARFFYFEIGCSQSPIFWWDRLDIPRLTVTAILIFKCAEGRASGIIARIMTQVFPRSLSSFDTHARWQPVTQSARSRWSYGKIEDCEQSNYEITSIISDQTVQFSYCCQLLLFLLLTYRLRKLISWTD